MVASWGMKTALFREYPWRYAAVTAALSLGAFWITLRRYPGSIGLAGMLLARAVLHHVAAQR